MKSWVNILFEVEIVFNILIVSFPDKRRVENGLDDSLEESPPLKLVRIWLLFFCFSSFHFDF